MPESEVAITPQCLRGARETAEKFAASLPRPTGNRKKTLRVLFQNRSNAFDMPGGDSVVMRRLKEELNRHGVQVDFSYDLEPDIVCNYDIVHLFNLTLGCTETYAQNAVLTNVPFVVTTLQEDFPRFYHKSETAFTWFKELLAASPEQRKKMSSLGATLAASTPRPLVTAPFAARAANMLCACGETEAALLLANFPSAAVQVVPFGASVKETEVPASLFKQSFGVTDFVLCVGRLERRKNQLMLLRALEDSDIPLVFADGGVVLDPEYAALCKKFARKGATIFTGRLSDDLLVSAFRACRAHCLPSWYELPGLVSLEAALYGAPLVASSWGCLPDYLGDACVWCDPQDSDSIREALMKEPDEEKIAAAKKAARLFTWETFGTLTLDIYDRAIHAHTHFAPDIVDEARRARSVISVPSFMNHVTRLVETGKTGEALEFYDRYRALFSEKVPELARFDACMESVKAKLIP